MRRVLALAAVAAASLLTAGQAAASIISVNFQITPDAGFGTTPLGLFYGLLANPTLTGSFNYDDATVAPNEILHGPDSRAIISNVSFTLGNRTFTDVDQQADPDEPTLRFNGGGGLSSFTLLFGDTDGTRQVFIASNNAFVVTDFDITELEYCNRCVSFTAGPAAAGPGGVPEPASWAMLIAGFGLTGAALRRRGTPVRA